MLSGPWRRGTRSIRSTSGTSARTRRSSGSCRTSRPPTPSSRRWCGRSTTCTRRCSGSRATARASRSGPTTARPPDRLGATTAPRVHAIEEAWLERVQRVRAVGVPLRGRRVRAVAGRRRLLGVRRTSAPPLDVAPVGDLLERHRERGIELRVLARPARRCATQVIASGYRFSMCRMAEHQSCSGRSVGNRMTSRIDVVSVSSITRRSMPMPRPAVGGSPYSRARR